jgi:Ala-tRNA(Pro) deacylase
MKMDEKLQQWLEDKQISYKLYTHPPVFTVPEAKIFCGHIKGAHCKNLFVKNKKTQQLYLVTIPYDKSLDMNQFRKMIGAPKVRFADFEELSRILGITPGAVSPLGLINDTDHHTIFMIDKELWNEETICCHPNVNTETLQIPGYDFRKLITETGVKIEVTMLPYSES